MWTAMFNLGALIVAAILALAGCATSAPPRPRAPEVRTPVYIPESTWWLVDNGIGAVSLNAARVAGNYARGPMEGWRNRVRQRTEADFIPWYTGFWTQEWLSIRVAWYKMHAKEGSDEAVKRLTNYLQEQYHDRVLIPVAKEIDPNVIREQATKVYVQALRAQLPGVARRYHIPPDQFDRRLKRIPAIALAPPAAHSASLHLLVHTDPITGLPAYTALIAQVRQNAGGAEMGSLDAGISPVARRASEKLAAKLTVSGGAGVAAAMFGGVAGMVISLGSAGFGAATYDQERPKMEAQLRQNLNAAIDDMWYRLMNDPATGVMAGVYYISRQIKGKVPTTLTQPVKFQPAPQEIPLPDEEPQDEESDDEEQTEPESTEE